MSRSLSIPFSIVSTRLPIRRIRSMSWVATKTVVPRMLISAKSFMISSERTGSRFPVGSSASRRTGSLTMARATADRCCSPPESSLG